MQLRRCQKSAESREVMAWLKERHYLHSTPPGYVAVLEFIEGHERIGAMMLGRPAARKLDQNRILSLDRMFFVDEAPKNTESHALSLMRKFVRIWFPGVRLLISYSDPEQGHTGGVYEADGWAPFGTTCKHTGHGWKSRTGRRNDPVTSKLRWVRTP